MDDKQRELNLLETRLKASELRALVAAIYAGIDDAPAARRIWRDIAGDLVAGQFLEACLDWDARMHHKKAEGWWYKDSQSWEEQGGFGERQAERCRKLLEEVGIIETRKQPKSKHTSAHTYHFRVRWEQFWTKLGAVVQKTASELAGLVAAITGAHTGQNVEVNPRNVRFEADETSGSNPPNAEFKPDEMSSDSTLYSSSSSSKDTTPLPPAAAPDARFITIWEAALNQIEAQLDRNNFDTWLRGARLVEVEGDTLIAEVRNQLVADYCNGRLDRTVNRIVNDAAGTPGLECKLRVRFESKKVGAAPVALALPKLWKVPQRPVAMVGGAG